MVAYIDRLLSEWKDDAWAIRIDMLVTLSIFLLGLMIYLFNQDNAAVNIAAGFVTITALLRLVFSIVEWRDEQNPLISLVSFGDKNRALMGAIIGGVLTVGLFATNIIAPVAILPSAEFNPLGTLLDKATVAAMFTLAIAPILEELFFRGLLFFTLSKLLKNTLFAVLLTSLIFAAFHFVAYGGYAASAESLMLTAFLMSTIWIFLNGYTKSISSSMTSHAILNYVVYFKVLG
jgi:membrane protease YdiL (CAAX protease family)